MFAKGARHYHLLRLKPLEMAGSGILIASACRQVTDANIYIVEVRTEFGFCELAASVIGICAWWLETGSLF